MNKNKGFTLIELVIVIVILGILAATAAPKFIDLTGDARESVMAGLEGSMQSAVEISHAKALIEGETATSGEIQIGSDFYALANGWPIAVSGTGVTTDGFGIKDLLEIDTTADTGDFEITSESGSTIIFTHPDAEDKLTCIVQFDNAVDAETRPDITTDFSGC
ncbi:type II secretion system protein [Thalassotalea fonticola]|uniref:Type II secretion system protein n=1 Tax=Thalassotalea fonticola TaxID=3065649 RepID=A0ABZ0GIZ9_9GAMM|nr:type II secretion system protein [Colwelliaceae bacterium S1-1]